MTSIVLTTGEPAGIGPELAVRLARLPLDAELVALGDPALLAAIDPQVEILSFDPKAAPRAHRAGTLVVWPVALRAPVAPGTLDARNSDYVIEMLARASEACLERRFDALVTGPVHKGIVADAGHRFSGHTEFFAEHARREVVMMLAAPTLRVALATTHLPLSAVPAAITPELIERTLTILDRELRERFRIAAPRIVVLGLNPHAGESGHLGREELDVIAPVLARLRAAGLALEGPLAADTAFVPERLSRADAFLAMYHDQGLPVLKALGFGHAVNVTLGLPYVRTSVDHGVALDVAGRGSADVTSLVAATRLALELVAR